MTKVGIVIPTKNRSDFLMRQLSYYADGGCKHTIYIGDSSEGHHLERTEESIQKLGNRANIVYRTLPGLATHQAIAVLSQLVEEPYVAVAGDDDFLVPASLEKCADFLNDNPDYGSAHGSAISFAVSWDKPFGEFLRSTRDTYRSTEKPNARLRLMELLSSYWPARFSVQRTIQFRESTGSVAKPTDTNFQELLASCLSIMQGKSNEIACLYLIRQAHIQNAPTPDTVDWITTPDWYPSYQIFHDCLAEALVRYDQVEIDEAEEVIKAGFWSYLARSLPEWRKTAVIAPEGGLDTPTPGSSVRRFAKAIPGISQLWGLVSTVRSINPPEPDKFSLPILLRPSSPYHEDFMPVFDAVSTPIA